MLALWRDEDGGDPNDEPDLGRFIIVVVVSMVLIGGLIWCFGADF